MSGVIRFVPVLTAKSSASALMQVESLTLSRIEQEGGDGAGQELVLTFEVWRLEPGT